MDRFGNDWSYDTLIRCRKFYTSYQNAEIVATPLPQLKNMDETTINNDDANVYATQYQLYLPDKALLQAKVKEWIDEFKEEDF